MVTIVISFLGDVNVVHVDAVVNYADLTCLSNSRLTSFAIADFRYQPDFSLYSLLNSLNFERSFSSGRYAILFGNLPYSYSNITHTASDFAVNPYVSDMFKFVTDKFPSFELNSCLINFYPDHKSCMPDHSDDEQAIDENSFIVTVSLGCDRTMNFKRKHSKELIASVTLSDGMVLIFSKRSQYVFTHGIPPIVDTRMSGSCVPRVSATFRKLQISA